jgi:hypothetical protein
MRVHESRKNFRDAESLPNTGGVPFGDAIVALPAPLGDWLTGAIVAAIRLAECHQNAPAAPAWVGEASLSVQIQQIAAFCS